MAYSAYKSGDVEAGDAFANNYITQPSKAIRAATALLGVGGAGGLNIDPQMAIANALAGRDPTQVRMTKWEENRVAAILSDYVTKPPPGIDPVEWQAQVTEQAYLRKGELWDKAVQQMFVGTAPQVLMSYFLGLGLKGRSSHEVEIAEIWAEYQRIRENRDSWTPEQISQAYLDVERRHPESPLLMLSRTAGAGRDDRWVWEAWGRVGIGNTDAWTAAGVSDAAINQFLTLKTTEAMTPELRDELIAAANAINAVYRPNSIEERQLQLDAKTKYKDILKQLTAEFTPEAFAVETEYYALLESDRDAATAFIDASPELQALLDRKRQLIDADPQIARYYSDPDRHAQYLIGQFYDGWDEKIEGIVDDAHRYTRLKKEGEFEAARLLLKERPELKAFWDAQDKFYDIELPKAVSAWLDTLPTSAQNELRDAKPVGLAQENLAQFSGEQQQLFEPPKTPEGTTTSGRDPRDQYFIDKAEVATETSNKLAGYQTGPNRDVYETTLYTNIFEPAGYDPGVAMEKFYAVHAEGWPVYETMNSPEEVISYLGDSTFLREKITVDTTPQWAQVAAYVRTLTPDQLAQLKEQVPDIQWVHAHAQQWDDGPSEAARADIVGFNVAFNIDGTITLSRMTQKEYESGTSDPGKGAPSGSGTGGTGTRTGTGKKKTIATVDLNKYYGGEGPNIPGRPRSTRQLFSGGGGSSGRAPRATQTSQSYAPQQQGENPDALIGEWTAFASTMGQRADLLVRIQDYFAASDLVSQRMLKQFPDLALWLSNIAPDQLLRLKKAYIAWALTTGAMGSTQAKRYEQLMPDFGPSLRYYSARSGRSGLQG